MHQHQTAHLVTDAVPIRLKLEMRLNFGCYKPRLSPTMLMQVGMSSSYSMDTSVSSGRTGTVFLPKRTSSLGHHLYRRVHSAEHATSLRGRPHHLGPIYLSRGGSIPVSAIGKAHTKQSGEENYDSSRG